MKIEHYGLIIAIVLCLVFVGNYFLPKNPSNPSTDTFAYQCKAVSKDNTALYFVYDIYADFDVDKNYHISLIEQISNSTREFVKDIDAKEFLGFSAKKRLGAKVLNDCKRLEPHAIKVLNVRDVFIVEPPEH